MRHGGASTSDKSKKNKIKQLERKGAEVIYTAANRSGKLNLKKILKTLSKMEITSVLIEGGSRVASSAIKEGLVDKLFLFYSPKIVGGDGLSMISELGIRDMHNALNIKDMKIKRFGNEFLIEAGIE